jgi:hypothetical protein
MNPWQIEASGHARRISMAPELRDDSVWISTLNCAATSQRLFARRRITYNSDLWNLRFWRL